MLNAVGCKQFEHLWIFANWSRPLKQARRDGVNGTCHPEFASGSVEDGNRTFMDAESSSTLLQTGVAPEIFFVASTSRFNFEFCKYMSLSGSTR